MAGPALKRQAVDYVVDHYATSHRRPVASSNSTGACSTTSRGWIRRLRCGPACERIRYGYRRLHVLLRREGWSLGKDQTYLWRDDLGERCATIKMEIGLRSVGIMPVLIVADKCYASA